MPKIWIKQAGAWKQVQRIYVKRNGVWSSVSVGVISQAGIGKQFFPDTTGATIYASYGTYSYTVPAGVTSVSVTVVGAGGGGGGNITSGNIAGGTGGGSGGYYSNQTLAVTPGEILNVVVGRGGYGGDWNFNGSFLSFNTTYNRTDNPGSYGAGPGGSSAIIRSGTDLYRATGGGGGSANQGTPGSGGSPNGVGGSGTYDTGNCSIPVNEGVNALGLGSGGRGGQCNVGSPGSDGYVKITPLTPTIITYSTPGTYSFTIPAGVTSITLSMVGGGGSGTGNLDTAPGAGGGSGAYWQNYVYTVTPGSSVAIVVGAASSVPNAINPYRGYGGADSSFGPLIAGGGEGGHWRGSNTPYPDDSQGGAGGIATGSGGVNGTKGGNAGNGTGASSPYGAGGAGAGSGNGGNASGNGAGGGGGGNNAGGGAGSNGFVRIVY